MTVSPATVLLATRNRASTLERVLGEYCRLKPPPGGWDVIVVDNGSLDETKYVVESFRGRIPISYRFESTPGKNRALNTGLASATGDLVVFTDDDILPREDWLLELCAAADSYESASIFAGIIIPRWEVDPPEWILRGVPAGVCFGIHSAAVREGPAHPSIAFGGNVAIRADVFRRGYRFNPTVGPQPTRYTMGGEAELIRRLVRDGHDVRCCTRAVAEHLIPASHLSLNRILERAVRWGRSQHFFGLASAEGMPNWRGVPRWVFRAAVRESWVATQAWLAGDHASLLRARWELHCLYGIAAEARSTRHAARGGQSTLAAPDAAPGIEAGPG